MNNFFNINSVVIIGASTEEGKIGNTLIKNLEFFKGDKFGINPKGGELDGIKFYKSISELLAIPDIAVFAIPAKFVVKSFEEIGKKGVKRAIIISAGFKEIGNIELENKLIKISKQYGINLLGPNCLGYVDTAKFLNLSFGTQSLSSCTGRNCNNISMVSQSGAMAVALTDWANSRKMGFSKMISMGNKAGINENDLLLELEKDDTTKVIALYLESIDFGEEFFKIIKRLSKKYPIVLVKSGISERGSIAASSHTGALSSKKEILYTAFKNSGIHFTQSLENFFLWSQIFSKSNLEDIPEELVIITNAGGPGVMATDHTDIYNVKLAKFSNEEKSILQKGLPKSASVSNPIDIIGDATSKTYKQILNNLSKIDKKRAILIMLTAQSITDVENIANVIIDFKIANPGQFLMVTFMGGEGVNKGRKILSDAGILEYDYPKKAIRAFSRLLIQKKWQKKSNERILKFDFPENIELLRNKIQNETKFCSSELTGGILNSFEIPYISEILVNSEKEVKKAYKELNNNPSLSTGYTSLNSLPLILKGGGYNKKENNLLVARISSSDIPHKSDVGGVILNIGSKKEAIKAYNKILNNVGEKKPKALIKGVTFSKMLVKTDLTREIFVGFKRDKSFGNILIIGMGGIYVNVFEDVSRRVGIVGKKEILNMLKELKSFPILKGVRGQVGINFESLIDLVYKLQYIFKEFEEILEIDINPIFSDEKESIVVDAKFYL